MNFQASIIKTDTKKGDGGINVKITVAYIAETESDLGPLYEAIEMEMSPVLVTIEKLQGEFDFKKETPSKKKK